jgi:hypothetical protein
MKPRINADYANLKSFRFFYFSSLFRSAFIRAIRGCFV